MRKDVLRNLGVDERKVALVPNAVDLSEIDRETPPWTSASRPKPECSSPWDVSSRTKGSRIWCGPFRGFRRDFLWLLVGEGPERAALEARDREREGLSLSRSPPGPRERRRAPRALRAVRPLRPSDALRRKLDRHARGDGPSKGRRRDPRRRHSRQDRRRRERTPGSSGRLGRAREGGRRSAERRGATEVLGREKPRGGGGAILLGTARTLELVQLYEEVLRGRSG